MRYDVCVIGGGAAGLAAASALSRKLNICIIEKNENPGRKIMATGGGRCNLTNLACDEHERTLGFFASLGLLTYADEEGRVYPYSNRASDVVEILMRSLGDNVDIYCNNSVSAINKMYSKNGMSEYVITTDSDEYHAENVIIATGGKAAPQFGTTGDGYKLATSLDHKITRLYPILTGIETIPDNKSKKIFKNLKGIRSKCRVSLIKDDVIIGSETGEVQFTEYGVSGICIFNLTPLVKAEDGEDFRTSLKRFKLSLDFAPDIDEDVLKKRNDSFGIVTERLAKYVNMDNIRKFRLHISGVRGWKEAQCTAGGIFTGDINLNTMESKISAGLYFAGEILDIQGPCGGYNLENAWNSGIKAAKAINEKIK